MPEGRDSRLFGGDQKHSPHSSEHWADLRGSLGKWILSNANPFCVFPPSKIY